MYTIQELNASISTVYEKIWGDIFIPRYNVSAEVLDKGSYIGSDKIYVHSTDEDIIIPYIATNILLVDNSQLYYVKVRYYINGDIENERLLNRDPNDIEATNFYNSIKDTFMNDLVSTILIGFDTEDFKLLCNNKSRRFLRSIEILKSISNVSMAHLPDAKVFELEDFIEYQLLKGYEYVSTVSTNKQ